MRVASSSVVCTAGSREPNPDDREKSGSGGCKQQSRHAMKLPPAARAVLS